MAKKKGAFASPFVPVEEQPYLIPENWCWTRLNALVETSKEKTDDFLDGNIKYVGLEHMEKDGGIIGYSPATEVKSLKAVFHVGQILYGKLRPYLNKHDIAGFEGVCSTDILVFNTRNCANSHYVNYFFDQRYFIEYAVSNSKGINLPRVSESSILEAICPLPPLDEQHRIVDRIESLFTKLDKAKEKVQAVVDSFELRKSAILHKAFTGELTERWRKEYGVGPDTWRVKAIKDVAIIGSGGTPSRKHSEYYKGSIPWIKTGQIMWDTIFASEESISQEAIENSSAKIYPAGTVVVAMYGQGLTRGRAGILGIDASVNQAVCALQAREMIQNKYLYYYFMTFYWDYRQRAIGGNQPNYSATMIGKWEIKVPTLVEQSTIVKILDDLLEKECQILFAVESVLDQIDIMKKTILARAFRGELGTNDPAEEWTGKLVKNV